MRHTRIASLSGILEGIEAAQQSAARIMATAFGSPEMIKACQFAGAAAMAGRGIAGSASAASIIPSRKIERDESDSDAREVEREERARVATVEGDPQELETVA